MFGFRCILLSLGIGCSTTQIIRNAALKINCYRYWSGLFPNDCGTGTGCKSNKNQK